MTIQRSPTSGYHVVTGIIACKSMNNRHTLLSTTTIEPQAMARPKADQQLKQPVRVALFIEAEQHKKLKVLADETGAPWASFVRRAIDVVLAEHAGKKRRRK